MNPTFLKLVKLMRVYKSICIMQAKSCCNIDKTRGFYAAEEMSFTRLHFNH